MAVPWLGQLVTRLSPWRPGSVHVGFVVDKVGLGQVFLQILWFSPSVLFHRVFILIYNLGDEHLACWWLQFRDTVLPHWHEQQLRYSYQCLKIPCRPPPLLPVKRHQLSNWCCKLYVPVKATIWHTHYKKAIYVQYCQIFHLLISPHKVFRLHMLTCTVHSSINYFYKFSLRNVIHQLDL
jgi:hypothetical protein